MTHSGHKYVVKIARHGGAGRYLRIALAVLVAAAAGGALYAWGHHQGARDSGRTAAAYDRLRDLAARLRDENDGLRSQAAMLQQGSKIDHYAYRDVTKSLKGLQDEIYELKEEVAFYRTVLEPPQSGKGLRIQSLQLARQPQPNHYRFRLVLTQVITETKATQGEVEMTVYGQSGGSPAQLSLKDLTGGDDRRLRFHFRYFQKLQGDVVFPAGFTPARVVLRVDPQGRKAEPVERTFEWDKIKV